MSPWGIAICIVVAVIFIWVIATFNKFKRLKVIISEAWSGIDIQLKRKANIIPNLVDVLKMQISFEKEILVELTNARSGLSSADHEQAMNANDKVDQIIASIRATAEAFVIVKIKSVMPEIVII